MNNLTTVYEIPWLIEHIHSECDRSSAVNSDKLEDRVIASIASYLGKNEQNTRNKAFLFREVKRLVSREEKNYRREQAAYFADMITANDDGEETEFEPVDVLANVEARIIEREEVKTTVDLLAQEDRRKKIVLTAWAEGIADATYISDTLASVLGGNAASHRVFIQRFKKKCECALAGAAV